MVRIIDNISIDTPKDRDLVPDHLYITSLDQTCTP